MKKAELQNTKTISKYLRAMYIELDSDDVIDDETLFNELAKDYITNHIVMFDERGFFVLKEESVIVKKTKYWNGIAVYIKPDFRHTRALKDFYTTMFGLVDGVIMGYTEANSVHNKVLLKRHNLLGYVYKLNRS